MRPQQLRLLGAGQPTLYPGMSNLLAGNSTAAAAWNGLSGQVGSDQSALYDASSDFYNAWNQLKNQGLSDTLAGNAAASLGLNNNTLGGIVTGVEGLVQGAATGNVAEISQAFTGTLTAEVGAAVAAGSISFGVGAAIVVGIEIVATAIGSLFGGSAPSATICGEQVTPIPTFAVGCCWSGGAATPRGPGSGGDVNGLWRRFPEPSKASDAWWFTPLSVLTPASINPAQTLATTRWTSSSAGPADPWAASGRSTLRPIDVAFPQYHQLECDVSAAKAVAALPETGGTISQTGFGGIHLPPVSYTGDDVVFAKFILAYFAAWKANQEYAINGIAPKADDGDVLLHLVNLWSKARKPGATRSIVSRGTANNAYQTDVITYPSSCQGGLTNEYWYIAMMLYAIQAGNLGSHVTLNATSALQTSSNPFKLIVNTGALTAQSLAGTIVHAVAGGGANATLRLGGNVGGLGRSTGASAGKVALYVGVPIVLAAGGYSLWAYFTGQAQSEAWKRLGHTIWDQSAKSGEHLVAANPLKGAKLLGAGEAAEKKSSLKVQSLLFPKSEFTVAQSRAWARAHQFKAAKVEGHGEYHRIRQFSPARSTVLRTIPFGDSGIKAVVAR